MKKSDPLLIINAVIWIGATVCINIAPENYLYIMKETIRPKIVLAASLCSFNEWYDYALYGFFTPIISFKSFGRLL